MYNRDEACGRQKAVSVFVFVHTLLLTFVCRCESCYQHSLERIWYCFHPDSDHSGIDPHTAVFMIENTLRQGHSAMQLASQLQGDHATNDRNKEVEFNSKTKLFGYIFDRKRRCQEVLHALMEFLDSNSHLLKTYLHNDKGYNKELGQLRKKRMKATEEHVRTLNVDELMKFTDPLYDEETGGWNFDLHKFLNEALPHWKARAERH